MIASSKNSWNTLEGKRVKMKRGYKILIVVIVAWIAFSYAVVIDRTSSHNMVHEQLNGTVLGLADPPGVSGYLLVELDIGGVIEANGGGVFYHRPEMVDKVIGKRGVVDVYHHYYTIPLNNYDVIHFTVEESDEV